jgi:bacterioferritin (cytochrome b1)
MANLAAPTAADVDVLTELISLEQQAQLAYSLAAKTNLLAPAVLAVAVKIVGQHAEHEKALSAEVTKLGGKVPTAPTTLPGGTPTFNTQADILNFALQAEQGAANSYFEALTKLQTPALKQLLASIMSDEAQHATVLASATGKTPFSSTSFMPIKL